MYTIAQLAEFRCHINSEERYSVSILFLGVDGQCLRAPRWQVFFMTYSLLLRKCATVQDEIAPLSFPACMPGPGRQPLRSPGAPAI